MRLRDDYLATYNDIIYNTFFLESIRSVMEPISLLDIFKALVL